MEYLLIPRKMSGTPSLNLVIELLKFFFYFGMTVTLISREFCALTWRDRCSQVDSKRIKNVRRFVIVTV